jgi:hypothetical protein
LKPGEILTPMQGVELRMNPKNGFLVFQVHYTADPEKRDPKYIQTIKEAMPIRDFNQEYELQWDSFQGLAVYGDWDQSIHGVNHAISPLIGLPLLLGVDFGLTPALLVCQLQEETLCCIKEFTALNMGAERFFQWVIPQLKTSFHLWQDHDRDFLVFIDPSGFFRKDTDEGTCAQVIDSVGFKRIIAGPVSWEERKKGVESFLTRRTRTGPCLKVSIPNCPVLARGFQGGYRYDDRVLETEPNKLRPIKDNHSHVQDALQYVCSKILMTKPSTIVDVPRLQYSQDREYNDRSFQS